MQFVCLVYHEDAAFEAMSPSDKKTLDRNSLAYDRELESKGNLVLAHALQSERRSKIVRRRKRKTVVLDGPFTETKEQLVGFIVIEASDLDEAVEIGAGIPLARTGTIIVRPTLTIEA